MLEKLISFSLRNPSLILILSGLLLVMAGLVLSRIPVDIFPELDAPRVVILTESGGLAADEVEQYVTFPIESALNGIPGVRSVRSSSAISLSIVWVDFDWDMDIYRARQLVNERLNPILSQLPKGAHCEIAPITSITGEIMLIALRDEKGSYGDLNLRSLAEFELRNRLLSLPGVAQVVPIGGEMPEYQVLVSQEKLRAQGLSLGEINAAARDSHSIASGGYLPDLEGQEIPIRQTGRIESVEDLKNTLLRYRDGAPLLLKDAAQVQLGGAPKRGTAADMGHPAVVLSIKKTPDSNTLELTEKIDQALDDFSSMLPAGVVLNRHAVRQADFIQRAINNVLTICRDAAIIVSIVLILFLLNIRIACITLTVLPLSLAGSIVVLWLFDMSINVMTLGGLAVALGELVDDAIVDVENSFRRLRENAKLALADQKSRYEVLFSASSEVRGVMVFSAIIISLVFVPLLFLQGLEGRFFRPLGASYIIAIALSTVLALTVTPAMNQLLLRGKLTQREHDSKIAEWLRGRYRLLLEKSLQRRRPLLLLSGICTLATLLLYSSFGSSFLPRFNEGTLTLFVNSPIGTSLPESNRIGAAIDEQLLEIPGVLGVTRRTGRAERDEHAEPVSNSEIEVRYGEKIDPAELRANIDQVFQNIPGIVTMIGQPLQHRMSHILSGVSADLSINIFGQDLAALRAAAKEIEAELKRIPDARDVAANREIRIQTLPIRYRRTDLAHRGLSPAQAADQVATAFYGKELFEVNAGIKRYPLSVRLIEEERADMEDLRNFLLENAQGELIRLEEVADIGPEETPNLISRENVQRKALITCNVAKGANMGHLIKAIEAQVQPIVLKHGLSMTLGGQHAARKSALRTISLLFVLVVLTIFMLMKSAVGNYRGALIILLNLPLSFIGGILAVFLTGSDSLWNNLLSLVGMGSGWQAPIVSVASLVGFITLLGIATRNGLLLVQQYQRHLDAGLPLREAIIQGSLDRLLPIIMTALVTLLGLLPIILAADEAGGELLAPIAIVQLGGLSTSTLLNLIVVPAAFYSMFKQKN